LLSVLTGTPSHGKTTFLNCLIMNLVEKYGIKIAVFSPENKSRNHHIAELIKTKTRSGGLDAEKIRIHKNAIEEFVQLIELPYENRNLESIFGSVKEDTKFLIIDPWNSLEGSRPATMNKTDHIGNLLRHIKAEARDRNLHALICAHPAKPMADRSGKPPEISLYSIADSAHWANAPDLGFKISRNQETNVSTLTTLKVRYSGRNGIQGQRVQFRYKNFQFEELTDEPIVAEDWQKKYD